MLLYAKTEELIQPDNVYQMHGNQITVRTLDLNLPFADIAKQLDDIAEAHFGIKKVFESGMPSYFPPGICKCSMGSFQI